MSLNDLAEMTIAMDAGYVTGDISATERVRILGDIFRRLADEGKTQSQLEDRIRKLQPRPVQALPDLGNQLGLFAEAPPHTAAPCARQELPDTRT